MRTKAYSLMLAVGLWAGAAGAATVTWDGSGDMTWTQPDPTSWGGATNLSGDTVQFLGAGAGTVNIDSAGVTPGGVVVNSSTNYTFSGGSIGGSGTLTKQDTGTLVLKQTNTYSGATTVNAGTLLLDGGAITNSSSVRVAGNSASLILTNGARFVTTATIYDVGYGANSCTMTVVGGTGTSILNGKGGDFGIGYNYSSPAQFNRLVIGAGGVVTNVSTVWVGSGGAYTSGHGYNNQLVMSDGGKLFANASLRIGVIMGGGNDYCNTTNNSALIANGSVVRAGAEIYVGAFRPEANNAQGSYNFNSLTITNGGQLYSGGTMSCIGRVLSRYTTAKANNNTVTIAGSLNGTNALWDLGGKPLIVGFTTNASTAIGNVLTVGAGGVATNIGSLTVSATNTLSLGAGGQVYAGAVTNDGTLIVGINDLASPTCGRITATGHLNVTNATLTIVTNGMPAGSIYVIASYGTLAGAFAATNGVPPRYLLYTNYHSLNQIALAVPPPAGTVIAVR